MIVYTAGLVAAFLVLTIMWKWNADTRYEAWYRSTITRALNGEEPDKGVAACEKLIAVRSERTNVRFALAELLYKQGRYQDAQAAYEALAALPSTKPEEKAWALVGQAASVFANAPKGSKAKAAEQAEALCRSALEQDKNCTDALVNLGLALAWKDAESGKEDDGGAGGAKGNKAGGSAPKDAKDKKGEAGAPKDAKGKGGEGKDKGAKDKKGGSEALKEAVTVCEQALAATAPASLGGQTQLYALRGYLAMQRGQSLAATVAFEQVRAMQPGLADVDSLRRAGLLAGAIQPGVEPQARRELLAKVEAELGKFGKDQIVALNALGVGFAMLKGVPDFAAGPYITAEKHFRKALDIDAKDPRAYYGLASLMEDRVEDIAKKASVPFTGFTGETPIPNKWASAAATTTTVTSRFSTTDNALAQEIVVKLLDEEKLWQRFIGGTAPSAPDILDAQLRKLACMRRRAYLAANDALRLDVLVKLALPLAQEVAKANPASAVAQYTLGRTLLDKEDYLLAYKAFQAAEAAGMKSPELERLLKVLGTKPEILDVRPPENREKRWFGARPLIGGTLKAFTSAGPLKAATVKMGETVLPASSVSVVGSQVLFLPAANQVVDGQQSIAISVTDAMGQTTDFPPFTLSIDKKPPAWSVTPDNNAPLPVKPVFTITFADPSDIDFSTVKVLLKKTGAKGVGDTRKLIEDGRYKQNMQETNPPRKMGFPLDTPTFQVSPGLQDLTAGEWELSVSVQDMVGNQLNDAKKYQVK